MIPEPMICDPKDEKTFTVSGSRTVQSRMNWWQRLLMRLSRAKNDPIQREWYIRICEEGIELSGGSITIEPMYFDETAYNGVADE